MGSSAEAVPTQSAEVVCLTRGFVVGVCVWGGEEGVGGVWEGGEVGEVCVCREDGGGRGEGGRRGGEGGEEEGGGGGADIMYSTRVYPCMHRIQEAKLASSEPPKKWKHTDAPAPHRG